MASGRQRKRTSKARQAQGGAQRLSRSARIWLATLSTVVGLATGMFTLRDQLFPGESGSAQASLPEYQQSVGDLCRDLNEAERARAEDARRLAKRLRRARTTLAQRNALLDGVRRSIARGGHELALFEGLNVPSTLVSRHRATAKVWDRNLELLRDYAQRLDGSRDARQLSTAIEALSRSRPALGRNGVSLRAGLVGLAGGRCRLDPPIVDRTITLPASSHDVSTPTVARRRARSSGTTTPTRPGATPEPSPSGAAGRSRSVNAPSSEGDASGTESGGITASVSPPSVAQSRTVPSVTPGNGGPGDGDSAGSGGGTASVNPPSAVGNARPSRVGSSDDGTR
jgi:hypothetical protein